MVSVAEPAYFGWSRFEKLKVWLRLQLKKKEKILNAILFLPSNIY